MQTDLADLLKVRQLREDKALAEVRRCKESVEHQQDVLHQALAALQRAHDEWAALEAHLDERIATGDCDATAILSELAVINAKSREIEARDNDVRKAKQALAAAEEKLAGARKAHQATQVDREKVVMQQEESSRIESARVELAAEAELDESAELLVRHTPTNQALTS